MEARSALFTRVLGRALKPQFILLAVVALVVSRGITRGELHYYSDEMRHAFTGVFFRDFLVDLPLAHPVQYAYEYYAKYPALGIPHWPPLFHMVEGVLFLVFGISVWVSRLAILGFTLLGCYFWYRIAENQGTRSRAFLSALIFASMPYVLLFEKATMLEIPGLALCLGAIWFWLRMLETERPRDIWAVAAFSAAAFLTSQVALFLFYFFLFDFLVERRFRLLKRGHVCAALAAVAAVVLPWYLFASRTLTIGSTRVVGRSFNYLTQAIHYTFYFSKLTDQLGPVLLCLTAAGLGCALLTAPRRHRFFLLWVFSCYLCFTVILEKDARHTMIWIPPLVYFALLALEVLFIRSRWALAASVGLAAFFVVNACRFERPRVTGVEEVARYVLSLPEPEIVYYQGDLNGDFVFFVRKFDPQRRHMVAREKQVVVSQIEWDRRSVLRTRGEVLNFFRTWGIRYAVVESRDSLPGLYPVRRLLSSDQFELLRIFPLQSNDADYTNLQIYVYRFRGELRRTNRPVIIPMMTIRNDIRADLSRLVGKPWPN